MALTGLTDKRLSMQMLQEIHNTLDKTKFIVNNKNIIGGTTYALC